ncbi:hypothetical protein HJW78_11390 [Klebsiella pneumoniae]|nr:hypothetical protein HJW78_11390 [Klebsiella pneumoniae]
MWSLLNREMTEWLSAGSEFESPKINSNRSPYLCHARCSGGGVNEWMSLAALFTGYDFGLQTQLSRNTERRTCETTDRFMMRISGCVMEQEIETTLATAMVVAWLYGRQTPGLAVQLHYPAFWGEHFAGNGPQFSGRWSIRRHSAIAGWTTQLPVAERSDSDRNHDSRIKGFYFASVFGRNS